MWLGYSEEDSQLLKGNVTYSLIMYHLYITYWTKHPVLPANTNDCPWFCMHFHFVHTYIIILAFRPFWNLNLFVSCTNAVISNYLMQFPVVGNSRSITFQGFQASYVKMPTSKWSICYYPPTHIRDIKTNGFKMQSSHSVGGNISAHYFFFKWRRWLMWNHVKS